MELIAYLHVKSFNLDSVNQVDNTGKLEFQEFKVFWEKMKKWIVRVGLCVLMLKMSDCRGGEVLIVKGELVSFQMLFLSFDTDRSGKMSSYELRIALKAAGESLS